MMHHELVEKRRWVSEHRYLHALNYGMLLPGPEAIQLAIYISWLLHGVRGAIVAGVLFFLPAFVLLSLLAGGPLVEATRGELHFTAAVVGVILNLAVFFAWHTFWPKGTDAVPFAAPFDAFSVVVAVAAFVGLFR